MSGETLPRCRCPLLSSTTHELAQVRHTQLHAKVDGGVLPRGGARWQVTCVMLRLTRCEAREVMPMSHRDGKPSECIMYYCYGDKIKMEQMMAGDLHGDRSPSQFGSTLKQSHCGFRRRFERGAITPQSFQLHKDNLLRMVSYCENTHECRCVTPHSHLAASHHRPPPGGRCSCLISAKQRSTVRSARVRGSLRNLNRTHLAHLCTSRIPLIQRLHRHVRQLQKRSSSRAARLHAACAGVNAADGGCQQVRVHRLL